MIFSLGGGLVCVVCLTHLYGPKATTITTITNITMYLRNRPHGGQQAAEEDMQVEEEGEGEGKGESDFAGYGHHRLLPLPGVEGVFLSLSQKPEAGVLVLNLVGGWWRWLPGPFGEESPEDPGGCICVFFAAGWMRVAFAFA